MQLAMIGLGRMGGNMVRRLMRDGHDCVVYARSEESLRPFVEDGAKGVTSYEDLAAALEPARALWLLVAASPACAVSDDVNPLQPRHHTRLDERKSHSGQSAT